MTDVYAAVKGDDTTCAVFSTLDKAMAGVEAHIVKEMRRSSRYKDGPLPELFWVDEGGGHHRVRAMGPDGRWYGFDPQIFTMDLDPEEIV